MSIYKNSYFTILAIRRTAEDLGAILVSIIIYDKRSRNTSLVWGCPAIRTVSVLFDGLARVRRLCPWTVRSARIDVTSFTWNGSVYGSHRTDPYSDATWAVKLFNAFRSLNSRDENRRNQAICMVPKAVQKICLMCDPRYIVGKT